MAFSLRNPFKKECCYNTFLPPEEIRKAIRYKISERGFFSWMRTYRGYYRKGLFLLLSQATGPRSVAVKIKGRVLICADGTRLNITYQPLCSPFYILVPLAFFLVYTVFYAQIDSINGKPASQLEGLLFSVCAFSFIATAVSFLNFKSLRKERLLLERELGLRECADDAL